MSLIPNLELRDYFAAKVMPQVYAEYCRRFVYPNSQNDPGHEQVIAEKAYRLADAMLAARTKIALEEPQNV